MATITRTKVMPSSGWLLCVLLTSMTSLAVVVTALQRSSFWSTKYSISSAPHFGIIRQDSNHIHHKFLASLRGGSSTNDVDEMTDEEDEDEEEASEDEAEEDEEDEETRTPEKAPAIASMKPVRLIISTNWGNSVIDQTVELTPKRTRDVGSLKVSLSKQLLGRPPVLALDLVYEGRILDDDTLVDELFEEDEEEDEDEDDDIEEGNEPTRKLTLNLVPPVNPKFATELAPKLLYSTDDDDVYGDSSAVHNNAEAISTKELVDAYYLNQVSMFRNAQLLSDPSTASSPMMRLELQEQAQELREQLRSETPADVWEKCMQVSDPNVNRSREEWRGQRYRGTKGGVSRQMKTVVQTNLNVDWGKTIKHFLLFLFLGYFGGKNSFSRHLLFWGAPLSFALQARPVKIWFKLFFYLLSNPPLILLSFLPAPQQAILKMDPKASCIALYGVDGARTILGDEGEADDSTEIASPEEESETDETEEEESEFDEIEGEEDGDEYDSEDEYFESDEE